MDHILNEVFAGTTPSFKMRSGAIVNDPNIARTSSMDRNLRTPVEKPLRLIIGFAPFFPVKIKIIHLLKTQNKRQQTPAHQNLKSEAVKAELKPATQGPTPNGTQIEFQLHAPYATSVLLAGDFTDWDNAAVPLVKGSNDTWRVNVSLAPGRHAYRFIVDGEWTDDPNSPDRATNPFGGTDSILAVKGPDTFQR